MHMLLIRLALLVPLLAMPARAATAQSPSGERPAERTTDARILDRTRVLRKPIYPAEARNGGIMGVVTVRVVIDADGELVSARAVSGPDGLRTPAVKATQSWEFSSSTDPSDVSGFIVFKFTMGETYGSVVGLRESDVAVTSGREDDDAADAPHAPPQPSPSSADQGPLPSPHTAAAPVVEQLADGVLASRATRRVAPRYPAAADSARIEGVVVVELDIDEKGRVTAARVRSGQPLLREAALSAAREWTFNPVVVNGAPVRATGSLAFNFRRSSSTP